MTDRPLLPVPATAHALMRALHGALHGSGPAVLPVPDDGADEVLAAGRPDLPVDAGVAVVVTTSGSTGDPKGVLLPATALLASVRATHRRLGGPGTWLLAMNPRYIGGLQVLARSVVAGTTPVELDLRDGFRADAFVAATARLRLSAPGRRYTALVPTQLRRLLDAGPAALDALGAYDAVLVGAAAAPPDLLAAARAGGVRVVTTYGMSETCGGCVYDGHPLDGVGVELGPDGRIALRGPVLAAGYRLRDEATAAAFADGAFLSADLGRWDRDGRLVVTGRLDDVLVTGGEKVSTAAVETVLRAQPEVRDVAVVGVPDPVWGQRLEAFVVLRDVAGVAGGGGGADGTHAPADLRAAVRSALPRAAVPRQVRVVDALPLLDSGKVDRMTLAAWAADGTRP